MGSPVTMAQPFSVHGGRSCTACWLPAPVVAQVQVSSIGDCSHDQLMAIQWIGFHGKIYWFKPHIEWENLWFPVKFPLNQSNPLKDVERLTGAVLNVGLLDGLLGVAGGCWGLLGVAGMIIFFVDLWIIPENSVRKTHQ